MHQIFQRFIDGLAESGDVVALRNCMAEAAGALDLLLRNQVSAVDLQHLRYAVAAADHGSFRRAAEALLLQQSTLSRIIRQLEEGIGMAVFARSSGGVQATPAGRDFLHTARSILEQVDTLVTNAYRAGRGEAGRLSIGF
jgi:hypothetical protein